MRSPMNKLVTIKICSLFSLKRRYLNPTFYGLLRSIFSIGWLGDELPRPPIRSQLIIWVEGNLVTLELNNIFSIHLVLFQLIKKTVRGGRDGYFHDFGL